MHADLDRCFNEGYRANMRMRFTCTVFRTVKRSQEVLESEQFDVHSSDIPTNDRFLMKSSSIEGHRHGSPTSNSIPMINHLPSSKQMVSLFRRQQVPQPIHCLQEAVLFTLLFQQFSFLQSAPTHSPSAQCSSLTPRSYASVYPILPVRLPM